MIIVMPFALTGTSESVKDKRSYKEMRELLLLHRRYEEKAVRLFRKGLSGSNKTDEIRDTKRLSSTNTATDLNEPTKASGNHKKNSTTPKNPPKSFHLNDKDYLKQLLLSSGGNVNFSDRSVAQRHWDVTSTRAQLRLPKLDSIPPENKEIFYTALPKMPPLPKLKDRKSEPLKRDKKKKRNRHNSSQERNTFSSQTCLSVRQLPRDHFMLHDFGNGGSSSSKTSTLPALPRISLSREMDPTSEAITHEEGNLWLVPIVNIEIPRYRLEKWDELENGGPTTTEQDKFKAVQIKGVSSENRTIEDQQPKYKRNVHFSEFLHEIHLYSPISTAHSARSMEDVKNINYE